MAEKEFESASVIYGDINDYIERIWSEERFNEAINTFNDVIVIHDISVKNSIVHTDYEKLNRTTLKKEMVLLTHSPDKITSEWALCKAEKKFKIKGNKFYEIVGNKLYEMNADIYHKEGGKYYVGYKSEKGKYTVYEKDGLLRFNSEDGSDPGTPLYKVDLYEDLSGRYFPKVENNNAVYIERSEGKVELIEFNDTGSTGKIVENLRDKILRK